MPIRKLFAVLIILAVAASAPASGAESPRPVRTDVETRPNILLIVTDDQRAGTMGVMPKTRAIFKRHGTTYPNAYAVSGQCCPSRTAMWTGQYPHNNGVITNNQSGELLHERTIQRYLQNAGYVTAMAGKYLNRWDADENPPYFNRWAIHMGRSISFYYGGTWNEDGISDHVDRYSTDYVASKGVGFLRSFEANDEQPWFVYLTPFAPHIPSQPEPRYAEASLNEWAGNPAVFEEDLSDKPPFASGGTTLTDGQEIRANQLRTLMSVDDLVAKVFAEMDALGETEQTLAVYMSDNGNLWGEHGMRGKTNMYEQSHHIPLFVRWPGPAGEGTIDPRLVANVDVAPTIMSSAGIASDAGHQMDGLSLSSPETHDHILLSSPEQGAVGIRTLGYQYVEYYTLDGKEMVWNEYYDFVADPWQLTDVLHDVDTSNDVDTTELHDRLSAEVTCKGIFC